MPQNRLGPFAADPQTVHFLNATNVVKITDKLLGGKADAKKPFRMAAKDGVGEIFIYDDIGGGFFDEGTTAKSFAADLKALGKVRTLNIYINSPGGSVFEGVAIFNQLKRHSARIIVHVDGVAASVASVIAMAGDEINIAANGFVMIHEAWAFAIGNAAEFRKTAGRLEKISDSILDTYAQRTGTPENVIADMMAAETWMNAEEAVEHGFADKITEEVAIAAHFDLGQFHNVPENVMAKLDLAKNPPKVELAHGGLVGKDIEPADLVIPSAVAALAVTEVLNSGPVTPDEDGGFLVKPEQQAAIREAAAKFSDQPRTPHVAITKIRQHIQKRGIVRKDDDETAATA